jgi:hypothetical protein
LLYDIIINASAAAAAVAQAGKSLQARAYNIGGSAYCGQK